MKTPLDTSSLRVPSPGRRPSPWVAAIIVAGVVCASAQAQVRDRPGGEATWEPRGPLALSAEGPKAVPGASADAVYSNLATYQDQSFAAGGATRQVLNTITRMAADDLQLAGTPPYSINGFRFVVTNLNTVDVTARILVRFYLPNGPGGGPGTLVEARTYNPTLFTAGRVGTIKTSSTFVLRSSTIWAGIVFDDNSGTTGATAAQLDNLALGIFSPPVLGTSADRYFVTTAAGSFAANDPAGTIADFGGAPPADFGWEILTAQDVDLAITNSDGVATAFPGGTVTYTITASNAGPDTVFDARVVDAFPAVLTCSWTCAGSAGNTCAASGTGSINDATVALAVGGSVTYTATCGVSTAAAGSLVNTASILAPGTAVEADTGNNSASDSDAIGSASVVTLDSLSPNPAPLGSTVTAFASVATAASQPPPTGTIRVLEVGGSTLCTITLPAPSCAFTTTTPGGHGVVARYGGDANYTSGTSDSVLLVELAPPTIAKTFVPSVVPRNGTTTLTFALDNPNATTTLTGVGFTDPFPAGLAVAAIPSATTIGCGSPTFAPAAGDTSVAFAGGTLAPAGTCLVHVDVTATTEGLRNNVTSAVIASEAGPGGSASARLLVIAPPVIAKAFVPPAVQLNGTTTLKFTLHNQNAGTALTGVAFLDPFPLGLEVAATVNATTAGCGTPTFTPAAGDTSLSFLGGTIDPAGTCTVEVDVKPTSGGLIANVAAAVTSTEGGTGGAAAGFLVVVTPQEVAPPTIAKEFGAATIDVGATTTLTFTLTNPNSGPGSTLTGVNFVDPLPPGLTAVDGSTPTCGGTLTTTGGNTLTLAGATIAPGATCTFAVTVTGATAGVQDNVTEVVTSPDAAFAGGTASASLTVVQAQPIPTLSTLALFLLAGALLLAAVRRISAQ